MCEDLVPLHAHKKILLSGAATLILRVSNNVLRGGTVLGHGSLGRCGAPAQPRGQGEDRELRGESTGTVLYKELVTSCSTK